MAEQASAPIEEEDRGKAALTELFEETKNPIRHHGGSSRGGHR